MAERKLRMAFREDQETNVVRCVLVLPDGQRIELSTMNASVLRDVPGAWAAWKKIMSDALVYVAEDLLGGQVIDTVEVYPHEEN